MKKSLFVLICATSVMVGCSKTENLVSDPIQKKQATATGPNQNKLLLEGRKNLKGQNKLAQGISKYKLLVKFSSDAIADFDDNKKPILLPSVVITDNSKKDKLKSFHYRQAIPFNARQKSAMRAGTLPAADKGKFDIYQFNGWAYVDEAERMTPDEVLQLANELETFDFIEYAVVEPDFHIPPPATPNFLSYQSYRLFNVSTPPNSKGIDAEYAWSIGINGQGIRVTDVEYGTNTDHEDLASPKFKYIVGSPSYSDHGAAVAGIVMAKDNGLGMKGMVNAVDSFFFAREDVIGRAPAIATAITRLRSGDVIIYEMQAFGPVNNQYVPADWNQAVWDVTQTATNAGVIVVATAGNGNENLDGPAFQAYNARGDNGVIMVGAGSTDQVKASFSTYGSRVHVQGWGNWSVATCGYGDLYKKGGQNSKYTSTFSGTSSAAPIVASAVIAVQSWYKLNHGGAVLSPVAMRNLLIQTGSPQQGAGGHIGPIPNIKNAILSL